MKKRLLSAFLAVMMVLTMAPVAFAADGNATLQSKIDEAANGSTVTLDKDYSENIVIKYGKNITLDLGSNTLTNNGGDTITVELGATLTIEGNGTVDNVTHQKAALKNYGNATIKSGVTLMRSQETGVDPDTSGGNSYYTIVNNGTMTISGANVENKGAFSSMIINGDNDDLNTESVLTIDDGTFTGGINSVKNGELGVLTINNGTFTNTTQYAVMNWNKATINNGTFAVKDSAKAVLFSVGYNNRAEGKLTITGGTFKGTGSQEMIDNHYASSYTGTASITGGTFSSDVSAYVAEGYVQNNGTVEQLGETNAVAKVGNTYYKTLAEAVAAAKDGDTVKLLHDIDFGTDRLTIKKAITLDLAGHKITTNNSVCTLYFTKTATVTDSVGNGKIENTYGTANGIGIVSGGEDADLTLNGVTVSGYYGVFIQQGANVTVINSNIKAIFCGIAVLGQNDSNKKNTSVIVKSGTVEGGDYAIAGNGAMQGTEITITGGTIRETGNNGGGAIYHPQNGTLSISGDALIEGENGIQLCSGEGVIANITGGVIRATGNDQRASKTGDGFIPDGAALSIVNRDYPGGTPKMNVSGGYFAAEKNDAVLAYTWSANKASEWANAKEYLSINGGLFTSDPSAYCVTGKTGVSSGDSTYPWTVGEKIANTKPAEVADATVAATVDKNASDAAKDAAKDIGGATMAQNEAIKAAAKNEANKNTIDADTPVDGKTVTQKLQEVDSTITSNAVKIVYQTYIDVEVKDAAKENSTFTELTVELTPMYRVIAAKSGVTDYHVDVDKNTPEDVNAVQIVGEQPLTLTGKYEVTLQLPNGFVVPSDNKLSIKHQKSSGVEYYTGTVDTTSGTKMVTFETNGFSPFVISVPAASIGENVYPTLQAAADAAKSTDVISVKSGASHELNFTTTKSVKVKNETGDDVTVKFNGTDKKFGNGETETFSYTKPSSSGGSSSGKTTFKVVTSAVNNGGVNASPSSAEKGAAITITLSPDKGYKLDKLTVTDGSGKTVSTVKKSDTVYTFTMPASAVKVGVSYVKATETPSETKFNDVSANDWFASAVDYVTGKGMMNGTADNTFSPKANTTRGMVVTVLYRLENQPSTSAASFTDVASGAYYANAVAWANANGIVSGYGSGKFGPNDKVTREQLAAILYRYAQYKKYDVSVGEDTNILSYNDAQSISSYAIPAIQWACGAGVVTGKSGSKLDPKGNATRAEVAAMLMRFCENVK